MRGTSGASLAEALNRFAPVLQQAGAAGLGYGEQLFAVTAALDESVPLRRALTDPARQGQDKVDLLQQILPDAEFDDAVRDLLAGVVRSRWAHEDDLADAVEELGIDAVLASAQEQGTLERVEDEIFRVSRALIGQREANQALSDPNSDPERRRGLIAALLKGEADPATVCLIEHATVALRGRRFLPTLGWYGDLAAARRRRLVAMVTSAVVLSQAQLARLGNVLEQAYGRRVQINVTVDRAVLGGLRIQVGADVVDSTALTRIAQARRRLAS